MVVLCRVTHFESHFASTLSLTVPSSPGKGLMPCRREENSIRYTSSELDQTVTSIILKESSGESNTMYWMQVDDTMAGTSVAVRQFLIWMR